MPDPIILGMKPVSCVWMQCLLMLVLVLVILVPSHGPAITQRIDTSRDTQLQYTRGTLTTHH